MRACSRITLQEMKGVRTCSRSYLQEVKGVRACSRSYLQEIEVCADLLARAGPHIPQFLIGAPQVRNVYYLLY